MKILLTGANGYIGKRLLPILVRMGYTVVCCVRERRRFQLEDELLSQVEIIEVDFLKKETLDRIPDDLDGAYYLVHSMAAGTENFKDLEKQSALNFRDRLNNTKARHLVYLGGITNAQELSQHLASRKTVEDILAHGNYNFTAIRAGIILGSGSASFEIIRDLVEKLPFMIAPRWLNTPSQPIGIRNVIQVLSLSLFNEKTFNQDFDIGGPEILTYKEMLLRFARIRRLRRLIITIPLMTPRLSSFWLYFVTSTSYPLAVNLVNSMRVPVICRNNDISKLLGIELIDYDEAIRMAFERIQQSEVVSSWIDSHVSSGFNGSLSNFIKVPEYGCYKDVKWRKLADPDLAMLKIWSIGGVQGWYYANWLWRIRGFLDKIVGGVGLRRGRTNPEKINAGDALDFWRVILADKEKRRLLLFAEMKLPGEAWLEFSIDNENILRQTATFRPRGVFGRLYWYVILPFHFFIFNGMIDHLSDST
ncbi:MAG: SDR family oxidoreductase [Cyclobacteriaceae bacterium]|nr:SDR family oxidoreductase [Cyclobacteriaceae bacterium]